jgi:protein MBA1
VEKARQRRRKLEDEGEVEEVKKQVVKNTGERFHDNGVPKTVVEYLVLQKRVIRGSEEDWKVWGFAEESVPSVVARDERYWSSMLNSQVGSA